MSKIIISINPEYVNKIISGDKTFEYRTRVPKEEIDSLIIYSTHPVKKVVGEVEIIEILEMNPFDLWSETRTDGGVDKSFFDDYFKDRDTGFAYKLGKVSVYEEPKKLSDFGLNFAPQSFAYFKP